MKTLYALIASCSFYLLFAYCETPNQLPYYIPLERQQQNKFYTASIPNMQLHTKPISFSLDLLAKNSNLPSQSTSQFSLMPLNKISFMLNRINGGEITKDSKNEYGLGYYAIMKEHFNVSTHIGYGDGNIYNIHATGVSHFFQKYYFVQPNIIYTTKNKLFEIGFTPRVTFMNFTTDKITFDAAREQYNANQIYLLQHKPHQTFFEPAFVICYGWKFLKFKYGNSRAINLTNKDLNISERSYFFGISLNGSFKVNKKVNAKK